MRLLGVQSISPASTDVAQVINVCAHDNGVVILPTGDREDDGGDWRV